MVVDEAQRGRFKGGGRLRGEDLEGVRDLERGRLTTQIIKKHGHSEK